MMAFSKSWVVTFYLFISFILLRCVIMKESMTTVYDIRKSNKTGGLFFFCRQGQGPPQTLWNLASRIPKMMPYMWSREMQFSPSIFGDFSRRSWDHLQDLDPQDPCQFTRNLTLGDLGSKPEAGFLGGLYPDTICVYKAICNIIILHSLLYTTHYQPFCWVGFLSEAQFLSIFQWWFLYQGYIGDT